MWSTKIWFIKLTVLRICSKVTKCCNISDEGSTRNYSIIAGKGCAHPLTLTSVETLWNLSQLPFSSYEHNIGVKLSYWYLWCDFNSKASCFTTLEWNGFTMFYNPFLVISANISPSPIQKTTLITRGVKLHTPWPPTNSPLCNTSEPWGWWSRKDWKRHQ